MNFSFDELLNETSGSSGDGDPFEFLEFHHSTVTPKQESQEDEIIYMPFKQVREQNSCNVKLEPVYYDPRYPALPPQRYNAHSHQRLQFYRHQPYEQTTKLRNLLNSTESKR